MSGLRKFEITPGVSWVEVPSADLRVLCGCPADAVKHMMRRGLILPTVKDGVRCETGPNAILLSDVMVQNGAFCNLAEFPVLQMFYRQGMLLPKHPGNTGRRPLLIGRSDQVQAQLQYIYRGNYGLISEEELRDAGIEPALARDMMRLKLRFAFGNIQHPRALLATQQLEGETIEIAWSPGEGTGVTVRRIGHNLFQFAYQGDTVEVDLNLPPFEIHECPYTLGFHTIPRAYFAVIHSGDGDGWDIRRPTMGAILVYQGRIYLVDAGPNLIFALNALGIGINEIEGIFHTHSHDDHFAGLTTLIRADRRIKYFAAPMVRAAVTKKLAALLSIEEESFADYFEVVDLEMGSWNDLDGLEAMPIFSPHPVETTVFAFRVLAEGGYKTYAHFADVVGLSILDSMVVEDDDKPGLSRAWYEQVVRDYAMPADVKKVDIGGGLIHGYSEDFRNDTSGKIILSHTAQPLTDAQKRIGSGASFGTVDVLIPSYHDFYRRTAFEQLSSYFPSVGAGHLQILLNSPVVEFNPETILLREGTANDSIHLLLTGQVEMLSPDTQLRSILSAGALIGELTGLHGVPALETYRATSYVSTLRIPCDLYIEFVTRHKLFADIARLMESREFLQHTWLFGEVVATGTLNRIAKEMVPVARGPEGDIDLPEGCIGIIRRGGAVRLTGGLEVERLAVGDVFGEEAALFDTPPLSQVTVEDGSEIHAIPAATLADVPGVRWKLFETFYRRTRACAVTRAEDKCITWLDEYGVNIQRLDNHHRRLFEMTNKVMEAVSQQKDGDELNEALEFLLGYAVYHFAEEEALLARYGFPDLEGHAAKHKRLLGQVRELEGRLAGGHITAEAMNIFLQDWIVSHILVEDHRYAAFLNGKGVY